MSVPGEGKPVTSNDIQRVTVLGAGSMGHGIAEVAAIAGYDVVLRDVEEELVRDGYEQIEWSVGKLAEKGRVDDDPDSPRSAWYVLDTSTLSDETPIWRRDASSTASLNSSARSRRLVRSPASPVHAASKFAPISSRSYFRITRATFVFAPFASVVIPGVRPRR